ncbi:predicted protein [Botrytis cinerea T4]|uniref:Uncharacterized protein n=1 Tax=Botryotinia fuckeliana (strain T4) TaxID=999810 RepID=G2XNJ6_BOTF4|nr:predicted protein [Botrytis cinerea T4]
MRRNSMTFLEHYCQQSGTGSWWSLHDVWMDDMHIDRNYPSQCIRRVLRVPASMIKRFLSKVTLSL